MAKMKISQELSKKWGARNQAARQRARDPVYVDNESTRELNNIEYISCCLPGPGSRKVLMPFPCLGSGIRTRIATGSCRININWTGSC
jgi:hypothetical protein